ncbi:MAG: class I SAM-dependent methyltransferase [Nanoarchaeota archaeon]|nr:class I SAM-dependent methyltransferase [Nanoarchaeota archaeon]MCG2719078.1 class I SAM-dependent methyltransferase [Nanoarchaeota archaeon]
MGEAENELEIWKKYGSKQKSSSVGLGPHTSFQFKNSPRRILFSLSRYKFAQKMIGKNKNVLELGCSDGLGTYILAETAYNVLGIDFDNEAINWANNNLTNEKLSFKFDNFLGKKYGESDAVVAFDVIEHISKKNEDILLATICKNLNEHGTTVVGTPNITSRQYSSKVVDDAHVNMYDAERLENLMRKNFHNVFMFAQNDEMIHTGFLPMAHYLIVIGCCKKKM